ncbi:MAG: thioredoxin family protein [Bacteroidia bacterium]|nr:thioredoxin family protein [Bacteroidia bacterium]
MNRWIACLLGFVSLLAAQTAYEKDIQVAFSKAKKQKRPLWIMVSATWCGPCKVVEQRVLTDPRFVEALNRDFVPLKVYAASDEESTPGGDSLAKVYNVKVFPTFLGVEPSGELFYRAEGVIQDSENPTASLTEGFLRSLEQAKTARKELPEMRRRFQRGERSLDFLRSYLLKLAELGQKEEGTKVLEAYLKVAKTPRIAWLGTPGYVGILARISEWGPQYAEYVFSLADTLRPAVPSDLYEAIYMPILEKSLVKKLSSSSRKEWDEAASIVEQFIKEHRSRFPFVESMALTALWQNGLKSPKPETRAKAASLALRAVALEWPLEIPNAEDRQIRALSYNNLAWTFYEQVEDPDKLWVAVILAKQALAYAPDEWHIWDTLGALYYKLGRKRDSLETLDKAIQLAKQQGVPESDYEDTLKLYQKAMQLGD